MDLILIHKSFTEFICSHQISPLPHIAKHAIPKTVINVTEVARITIAFAIGVMITSNYRYLQLLSAAKSLITTRFGQLWHLGSLVLILEHLFSFCRWFMLFVPWYYNSTLTSNLIKVLVLKS